MLPIAYHRHASSEFSPQTPALLDQEAVAVNQFCLQQGWELPQWQVEQTSDWRQGFSDRLAGQVAGQGSGQGSGQGGSPSHASADPGAEETHPVDGLWVPPSRSDIVIHSLQRMFNSARDIDQTLAWMRDWDINLHVVVLNAEISQTRTVIRTRVDFDYMLREMLTLEQRRGAERMRRVKQMQRKKGRFLGGSKPFGYMIHSNGKLIENPLEQKVLRQIYQLRERGHSLREIARQVSTPIAPVSFKTVQRILKRAGKSNV